MGQLCNRRNLSFYLLDYLQEGADLYETYRTNTYKQKQKFLRIGVGNTPVTGVQVMDLFQETYVPV